MQNLVDIPYTRDYAIELTSCHANFSLYDRVNATQHKNCRSHTNIMVKKLLFCQEIQLDQRN